MPGNPTVSTAPVQYMGGQIVERRGGKNDIGTGLAGVKSCVAVPVDLLRQIGPSDDMKAQHRAHIIALARFNAQEGVEYRGADEKPAMRASTQRKTDARLAEIEEIRGLIPGGQPGTPAAARGAGSSLSPDEALMRLYSI